MPNNNYQALSSIIAGLNTDQWDRIIAAVHLHFPDPRIQAILDQLRKVDTIEGVNKGVDEFEELIRLWREYSHSVKK